MINETKKARKVFGKNVREKREAIGMSQESLALKSGLHRTYISDVERGERNISIDNIEKISKALNVSLDKLIT